VFTARGRPLAAATRRRSAIRTPAAVKEQWEEIKSRERRTRGAATKKPTQLLSGVPKSMPALLRAHEVSRRAAAVGFEWARPIDVVDKIDEEVRELRDALTQSPARAADELGDVLFSIANLARKLGLEPESALRQANDKFTDRFNALEAAFEARGQSVHGASLEEMERVWEDVKRGNGRKPKGASTRKSVRP
jgi:MazG family protein